MKPSVLVVDDEPDTLDSLADLLRRKGYRPLKASCLKEAQGVLNENELDAILLDEKLPDGSGIGQVAEFRRAYPRMAIVVITGTGDIPTAVKAIREGADDFLGKPVDSEELMVILERSLELEHLKWMDHARQRLDRKNGIFIGESPAAERMWSLARKAADNQAAVMLCGETGVGKGILARWIHENSDRKSKPFVEVNCSSLRGDLLASELFGHRKGAFTSAVENREGLLEVADGGTLFLDEIGDMDLGVQAQFLKVIEEKQFRRVGESKTRHSDFRLICATNRNLAKDSEAGAFRRDLYFRIFVFLIELPPLRTRQQDIPALAQLLLASMGQIEHEISQQGMDCLQAYGWPGNVREMRNILERACLIAGKAPLEPEHFLGLASSMAVSVPSDRAEEDWHLDALEARHLRNALSRFGDDVNKTAMMLGISRATLYRKLKKHQILETKT